MLRRTRLAVFAAGVAKSSQAPEKVKRDVDDDVDDDDGRRYDESDDHWNRGMDRAYFRRCRCGRPFLLTTGYL